MNVDEFESFFDLLWQDRQENILKETLEHDDDYNLAVKQTQEEMEALQNGLCGKLLDTLDNVSSAYNFVCSEYGRAAYRQGLRDGIQLIKDIMDL